MNLYQLNIQNAEDDFNLVLEQMEDLQSVTYETVIQKAGDLQQFWLKEMSKKPMIKRDTLSIFEGLAQELKTEALFILSDELLEMLELEEINEIDFEEQLVPELLEDGINHWIENLDDEYRTTGFLPYIDYAKNITNLIVGEDIDEDNQIIYLYVLTLLMMTSVSNFEINEDNEDNDLGELKLTL